MFIFIVLVGLTMVACSPHGPASDWPAQRNTNPDFWQEHGIFFLVFMALFPRITMLVATVHPIGCLSWFGWLFVPRILAAILASHYYWDSNPVLVVITWIVAVLGTGGTSSGTASAASSARG